MQLKQRRIVRQDREQKEAEKKGNHKIHAEAKVTRKILNPILIRQFCNLFAD
jgi:hypothetical protein